MARPKPRETVQIPSFLNGVPFKPKVTLQDVKAYEEAERAVLDKGNGSLTDLLEAKLAFLRTVLARSVPDGQLIALDLDLREAHDAFRDVWAYAFRLPGEEDPLG